jgi:hypothetical protein
MVNPISSASSSQASEAVKAAGAKPQPPPQQTTSVPSDKVTLKSTGADVDRDGDSH